MYNTVNFLFKKHEVIIEMIKYGWEKSKLINDMKMNSLLQNKYYTG